LDRGADVVFHVHQRIAGTREEFADPVRARAAQNVDVTCEQEKSGHEGRSLIISARSPFRR
jgi:hypothetical protein